MREMLTTQIKAEPAFFRVKSSQGEIPDLH
jgi:hypothetical protein